MTDKPDGPLLNRPRSHGHRIRSAGKNRSSKTYLSWMAMKQRCLNPHAEKFPAYGGRGITICGRWMKFENFLADMGERPDGKTLDRFPNPKGDYEPGNCRWATAKEQAQNSDRIAKGWKRQVTHCPAGHPYSGENVYLTPSGSRKCRACNTARTSERWRKLKLTRVLKGRPLLTHCTHGHLYDEANTYANAAGHRQCRTCGRLNARRYKQSRLGVST